MTSRTTEYTDPATGVRGWLTYHDGDRPLSAGGCRLRPGLTPVELAALAERMTVKQRVLGTNVGGAKCGLDLAPDAPGKAGILGRFLHFLRDDLLTRYSMGPDLGTDWGELSALAADAGVPSIKYAVGLRQGLTDADFAARVALLDRPAGGALTLGQRRAGHALGHAALRAARQAGASGPVRVTLQGFGNLGRAAALTLTEQGARLVAVADEHGCRSAPAGLDVAALLGAPSRTPVPALPAAGPSTAPRELFAIPADVLVLAGGSDAFDETTAAVLPCPAVVVGANHGLREEVEEVLHRRGVLVLPDFVGGIGGSASMEALFGPARTPDVPTVLADLARLMDGLTDDLAAHSRTSGTTPRATALRLAARRPVDPAAPPYGHCVYLT
ncbi:Glu/Leu/Phe/Val dehydrogenase dimerization domain-containing protein [Kitasatospora sp. NPDC002040]|uniref:Glu/Leu/Phe/Val dehydrogenase dimerization domain-containing protein n=1 Tax=Kitasatospora sp. NPDC002040 TaxID=3154661 RepID=UPI003321E84A